MTSLKAADAIRLGTGAAAAVYVGATKVWPPALSWTPDTIAGLVTWVDASDAASITAVSGIATAIANKAAAGSAYSFAQTSAGQGPATGTRTIGGLNALDFDGTNDELITPTFAARTLPWTLFMVVVFDEVNSTRVIFNGGYFSWYNNWSSGTQRRLQVYAVAGEEANTGTDSIVAATPMVAGYRRDPTLGSQAYLNGVLLGTGSAAASETDAQLRIGGEGGNYFDGGFGELLAYNSHLSDADVATVFAYLQTKWGI